MTRSAKILLAVVMSLTTFVFCCSGFGLSGISALAPGLSDTQQSASDIGRNIAQYTIPQGFTETTGLQMLGNQMVMISRRPVTDTDRILDITLVKPPADLPDDYQAQLDTYLQQFSGLQGLTFKTVETQIINGHEITLTYREGEFSEGLALQQLSGFIPTDNGDIFVIIQGMKDGWDQVAIDAFLNSIR